jgi:uncharacterized OsmC-like protein
MVRVNVREIQSPIRQRYKDDPQAAQIRLRVRSARADLDDPLHCATLPVSTPEISWRSGAHSAVGGNGDVPCSGDLLLGALAACQETTIRMGAANMGIELESIEVEIEADCVRVPGDVRGERADRLLRSAEKYCVVLNTLRNGVSVESTFSLAQAGSPG